MESKIYLIKKTDDYHIRLHQTPQWLCSTNLNLTIKTDFKSTDTLFYYCKQFFGDSRTPTCKGIKLDGIYLIFPNCSTKVFTHINGHNTAHYCTTPGFQKILDILLSPLDKNQFKIFLDQFTARDKTHDGQSKKVIIKNLNFNLDELKTLSKVNVNTTFKCYGNNTSLEEYDIIASLIGKLYIYFHKYYDNLVQKLNNNELAAQENFLAFYSELYKRQFKRNVDESLSMKKASKR
jgi:hypothetical protein